MRALLIAGGLCSLLALAGCGANSGATVDEFVTTMSKTNCHVTLSMSASVAALNPGSGAQFQAQADCPNGSISPAPPKAP